MFFNNNKLLTYILYTILIILIIYYLYNINNINIFVLLILLFTLLYITYNYNKILLHNKSQINNKTVENFDNNNEISLLKKLKPIEIYKKYLSDKKLTNILTICTYDDFHNPNTLVTQLTDLSNNKNKSTVILHKSKDDCIKLSKDLQNLYSINLGCNSLYIEPISEESSSNSFKNFNQNNFSLLWNMKFDNKLFNLDSIKDILPDEYNKYNNNGIFKYEIFNIRNYYSPSTNVHIPFILRCNYCIHKVNNDTFNIKYLEIELDDGTILNENDDKVAYNELYESWKNRYSTFKILAYDSVNENMEETNKDTYGFMTDNKEHTFSIVRENNTLKLYIDNSFVPMTMNNLNTLNTQFNVNNKGKIRTLYDNNEQNSPISFFNGQTTFNILNKNPGIFINENKMLNNSNTYITYLSLFTETLTVDNIKLFTNNIKDLTNKYLLLSNMKLQKTLSSYDNIKKKNSQLKDEVKDLKIKQQTCNFNNPVLCEVCSDATITDWSNINDIITNAGSNECLNGIINHCYNDPLDTSCPINKDILEKINAITQYKSVQTQFEELPSIDVNDSTNDDTSTNSTNNKENNSNTFINKPKNDKKKDEKKDEKTKNIIPSIDLQLYEKLINNTITKKLNNNNNNNNN